MMSTPTPESIQLLAKKWQEGTITESEKKEFDQWYHQQVNVFEIQTGESEVDMENRIYQSILEKGNIRPQKRILLWPRIAVAAAIALVILSSGLFYLNRSSSFTTDSTTYANDVLPGRIGATLTLANGKKIFISDAQTGNLAEQSGVKISKTAEGLLVYEITKSTSEKLEYNTLSTSRGEQSQVRLPDGTLVYLNAESSLTYPTRFTGAKKRAVELTGEGYFEVAKDKVHPFNVKSANQNVEVLGTRFNINAYTGQPQTRTTLMEGSIRVSVHTGQSKVLRPNQQSVLDNDGITIEDVEAEYAMAWKEGFFMFNRESLASIAAKLSGWYDIEVIFADTSLKSETFSGTINKFENLSKVLNMLERTKVVTFTLENRKLTISRKP